MLSRGAAEIKLAVGIQPDTVNCSENSPNPHSDQLSTDCKEYIEELEENPVDEARSHRTKILDEFSGMCSVAEIEESDILEWRHYPDLCNDDWLFIEAIQEYGRWGIAYDGEDKPIDTLDMGRRYAFSIDRFEQKNNDKNKFEQYAKHLVETKADTNCEKIKGIIAIRRIANGSEIENAN